MTNSKSKCCGYTRDATYTTNSSNVSDSENLHSAANAYRSVDINVEDEGSDDADETNNDSDTSTSFSLQECMNEFRARRIRRTSLHQHRQEVYKNKVCNIKNDQGTTELDLIEQNICNKEQERKSKPCQNGFCYCFTSDSGEGASNVGCSLKRVEDSKNDKCSDFVQVSKVGKRGAGSLRFQKENLKNTKKRGNILKAISSLETSKGDAPLIHIVQELHNNCVISTVRVNEHKVKSLGSNFISDDKLSYGPKRNIFLKPQTKRKYEKLEEAQRKSFDTSPDHSYIPSAPIFDDLESTYTSPSQLATTKVSERRSITGGQLLHKRLTKTQLNYTPRDSKTAPRKPPRTSITYDDKCSYASTSSVRKAERIVDNLLINKGVAINNLKSVKNNKHPSKATNVKMKTYPLSSSKSDVKAEEIIPASRLQNTHLSDIKHSVTSSNLPFKYENILRSTNNGINAMSIGWNDTQIQEMLNCNVHTKLREFHSSSIQAEPQQVANTRLVENPNPIGWQVPPKISLDTVDGIASHNLASNLEDKNTPVKTQLVSSSRNINNGLGRQKFSWSKHLKNLSPWTNKYDMNGSSERKQNLRSSSKAFVMSYKKKILGFVSPKKQNREVNSIHMRNVAVQTSYNQNFNIQHKNPESPPGSYHSPVQYTPSIKSQNGTSNTAEPQFDFSRTMHSPKITSRSSQRKLHFPLKFTSASTTNCNQSAEKYRKKTYRSFNCELDQDLSISKISCVLSNIRAKLEASDQRAERTFLETGRVADLNSSEFYCSNNHNDTEQFQLSETKRDNINESIYSEIDEDSVHITEKPYMDNHTSVQHFGPPDNPDVLYAKINKSKLNTPKPKLKDLKDQTPLATIVTDSLKSNKVVTNITPLPTLLEPPESESTSNIMPFPSTLPLSHSQSLNNIRVMEHNATPKKQRAVSKSDLSLHRSDFFLENLCKSELIVDRKNLENVHNDSKMTNNNSCISAIQSFRTENSQELTRNESASYDLPHFDEVDGFNDGFVDSDNSITVGTDLNLNAIVPPLANNQSTPKKKSFVAKVEFFIDSY